MSGESKRGMCAELAAADAAGIGFVKHNNDQTRDVVDTPNCIG
jgi:hypothetical protein